MPRTVTGLLRRYADLDYDGATQQTHYRTGGEGPPLLMLHPSPLDSAFLAPVAAPLLDSVTNSGCLAHRLRLKYW